MNSLPFIKWFADTTIEDIPIMGGKNASLGEMFRGLAGNGVKIPSGGINSISLNPDSMLKTTLGIVGKEQALSGKLTLTVMES
jgi:hypothetical protein